MPPTRTRARLAFAFSARASRRSPNRSRACPAGSSCGRGRPSGRFPSSCARPELRRFTPTRRSVRTRNGATPRPRAAVEAAGGRLRLFADALLVEPDAIASGSGDPYTVYTAFSRKWMAAEKGDPVPAPAALDTPELASVPIGKVRAWRDLGPDPAAPRGGEAEASRLLLRFFSGPAARYAEDRDRPDREGTSRLSPHLHFGTISPRTIRAAAEAASREAAPGAREHVRKFVLELAWREFTHHVLFHFPRVARESFRPEFDRMPWRDDPAGFEAWTRGRDRLSLRRRRDARAFDDARDAQPRAHGDGLVPDQGPAHPLEERGSLVRAPARGCGPRQQQRRLAVGGGQRDGRGTLLPNFQPRAPVEAVRSRRPATSAASFPRFPAFPRRRSTSRGR